MRDSRLAEDAAAVTRQGKYGPARVLAESCRVVRAEDVRVLLLESGVQLAPGAAGDVVLAVGDEADTVSCSVRWECRPNAVWSTGRLFLACPDCARGVGRLYIPPVNGVGLGCRECWGLGYTSKLENYRHGEALGLPHRFWASIVVEANRSRRYRRGRVRSERLRAVRATKRPCNARRLPAY
jgi:hypothetical protein